MIGRILFFASLLAVSVLPDNLADLVKFGEKPDEHKATRNRVRRGRRRRNSGGNGSQGDARELEQQPAIQPNGENGNDAVRENRSGGPAGGGGGEPRSANQGDPERLIPASEPVTPPDDNPAS